MIWPPAFMNPKLVEVAYPPKSDKIGAREIKFVLEKSVAYAASGAASTAHKRLTAKCHRNMRMDDMIPHDPGVFFQHNVFTQYSARRW